eukprot:9188382-Lingulodinium_polyedra.AAC.1
MSDVIGQGAEVIRAAGEDDAQVGREGIFDIDAVLDLEEAAGKVGEGSRRGGAGALRGRKPRQRDQ